MAVGGYGERQGTSFTKKGWIGIEKQFNESSGRNYDKVKLKNRYDNLRRDWRIWYQICGKETGLGWDHVRHTFDAPDEWWERKIMENPDYEKYREKGLPFAHDLTILYRDVVATGEHAWAPSSGVLPNGVQDANDGYRPSLENLGPSREEGSGDSEDDSVGATNGLAGINLNSSQGNVSQGVESQRTGEKRKRVSYSEKGKSKKNSIASSRIADAVNVIAETCKSRNDAVDNSSIGEVLGELQTIKEVSTDLEFHTKCCLLMMHKPARDVFVALRGLEEKRLHWLKVAANNP
ncbi:L10-interacting MYB domain-containing protein-like [Lotus japonicus]|uniref:L10-interacting MYB domain-containing protein-like n=1 Tax=Lotus japonicus TaxID=34305 RepID=UPI00258F5B5F|nr:L10-interacting MYB domain-containing protein-like [Lotus japonicus]